MTSPAWIRNVHVKLVTSVCIYILVFPFTLTVAVFENATPSRVLRLGTHTTNSNAVVGVVMVSPPNHRELISHRARTLEDYYWQDHDDSNSQNNDNQNNKNHNNDDDDSNDNDDRVYHHYKKAALRTTGNMWSIPPNQWSPIQWFLFSFMLFLFGSCFFCWCIMCIVPRCCGQKGTLMYSAMMVWGTPVPCTPSIVIPALQRTAVLREVVLRVASRGLIKLQLIVLPGEEQSCRTSPFRSIFQLEVTTKVLHEPLWWWNTNPQRW